jgi:hypothetical protein
MEMTDYLVWALVIILPALLGFWGVFAMKFWRKNFEERIENVTDNKD